MKERIYDQYMQAYKKGVFNYIKEDYDALSNTVIPKQYFSGGFKDSAMLVGKTRSAAMVSRARTGQEFRSRVNFEPQTDQAMLGEWTPVIVASLAIPTIFWIKRKLIDMTFNALNDPD